MPLIRVTQDYILDAGDAVSATNDWALLISNAAGSTTAPRVTINGVVSSTVTGANGSGAIAIRYEPFGGTSSDRLGTLEISPTGVLRTAVNPAPYTFPTAYGFWNEHWVNFTNRGLMDIRGADSAAAIYNLRSESRYINIGEIRVDATGGATGIRADYGATIINFGKMEITSGRSAYGISSGSSFNPLTVTNSGLIRVRDTSSEQSVGVALAHEGALVNSGTIDGEISVRLHSSEYAKATLIQNTGHLIGDLDLVLGVANLVNGGDVVGDIRMGARNDRYDGAQGHVSGAVHAGGGGDILTGGTTDDRLFGEAGNDTLAGGGGANYLRGDEGDDSITGGADFDDINGNMGNDTCVSGGGDDWVVGGRDNDSLVGSAGQNLVYGNLGNDTCEGGDGDDIVRGGQDNDAIFGGGGDDYVSGDKGDDTVTGGLGADSFHTFGDAGIDRVLDFSLAQGDRVQLDHGTQYTVSQVGADTVISMTGGGQMILVGVQMSTLPAGWIFGA